MPNFDVVIDGYTLVPNAFWGGAAFPLVVFLFLYLWPWLETRFTGDRSFHNLLERPRDAPWRTAIGMALLTWVFVVFVAGSADRVDVLFGFSYATQIWIYRVLVFAAPPLAALITYRVCRELQHGERIERERKRAEHEARAAAG